MQYRIGIDEAGRGPVAGPVSVGVFAVSANFDLAALQGVRDSKQLSERQREEWYKKLSIMPRSKWHVSLCGAAHIDKHGITKSVRVALTRALRRLDIDPRHCEVMLDGSLKAPKEYLNQQTIIHGDAIEPLISAASILAKVTRDRHMCHQAQKYSQYGFELHKGYGTVMHRKAIQKYGFCDIHRKSFCTLFGAA